MESQTQTTTVPPVSGTGNPGNETTPSITVSNGNQVAEEDLLTENNFPKPKPTPEEVKEPEDLESVEDRMVTEEEEKENKKQWEAYNGSDWSRYVALKKEVESIRQDGFSKSDEGEEDGKDSRHILANGEFRNRHEVNAHLLTQLCAVLETDADLTKRLEGYRYLKGVVSLESRLSKDEILKEEWKHNVKRMKEWADSGYPGDFEHEFLNKEGKVIMKEDGQVAHYPPQDVNTYWSKRKYRKEAAPEQSKITRLPPSETMDNILAEAGELLKKTAKNPEQIRGECGNRLGVLNDTIAKLSADYVAKYNSGKENEEDKIESLTDQRIPDVRIMQMIVEFVEQLVTSGKDDLEGASEVMAEYNLLQIALKRAGHPMEWFNLIETTVKQKVELARNLTNNLGTDYHGHPDLWEADLKAWLINKVETRGHHTSSGITTAPLGPEGSASNQQPATPGGPFSGNATTSALSDQSGMEGVASNGPSTAQTPVSEGPFSGNATTSALSDQSGMEGVASNGASTAQPPVSEGPSSASVESILTKKVLYEGQLRSVGGVRPKGYGHQYLVRTNDETETNPFWLMIAASKCGGEAQNYIEQGGYLVQTTKAKRDADRKTKNWVEGLEEHLLNRLGNKFVMKGIATEPRESGAKHTLWPNQIIQGHFQDEDAKVSRFYAFSTLAKVWGQSYVDELVYKHMVDNRFPMQAAPTKPRQPRSKPGQARSVGIELRQDEPIHSREQTNFMGKPSAKNYRADGGWTVPEKQDDTLSLQALKESIMTEVEGRLEDQRKVLQADFSQKMTAGFESQKADMANMMEMMKQMMIRQDSRS